MGDVNQEDVETDLEVIYLTSHAAQRQKERNITKEELSAAIQYGKKEPSTEFGMERWRYTWGDIAVVTNKDSSQIITVLNLAGPKVDVQKAIITEDMEIQHAKALERLKDKPTWTSHTVAVIDTSGSMRKTDTDIGISRSEMVWLTLAVSLVAKALKSGERDDSDVFSLVGMLTGHNEIFSRMPFDWILYNKLVDMQRTNFPTGHGDYFPALATAELLLKQNNYGGCALALVFLSDGMPSDQLRFRMTHKARMKLEISNIASRFGSRLTVLAIPVGKGSVCSDFATLKALVNGAKIFGCSTFYQRPSVSAHVLGTAFTKLTSTMTETKVTMDRRVCRNFRKEPITDVGHLLIIQSRFQIVMQKSVVGGRDGESDNMWTIRKTHWKKREGWVSCPVKDTFHDPRARGLAIKKAWFGEGAERLVKEIREVNHCQKAVGPLMVAKDTKYIHTADQEDKSQVLKDFHKRFMKCQSMAQKCAKYFNRQLARHPAIDSATCPQIDFLDCSVYMIQHKDGSRVAYLVEKMLDIRNFKYQKWNDNKGGFKVGGCFQPASVKAVYEARQDSAKISDIEYESIVAAEDKVSETGTENEVPDDSSVKSADDSTSSDGFGLRDETTIIDVDDMPQAFSCFSYWWSRRNFLVCDLQGILNKERIPATLELTDPCVHHRMSTPEDRKYGRTDHGVEGIQAFLSTHCCSQLCRMVRSNAYVPLDASDHIEFSMTIEQQETKSEGIQEHEKLEVIDKAQQLSEIMENLPDALELTEEEQEKEESMDDPHETSDMIETNSMHPKS